MPKMKKTAVFDFEKGLKELEKIVQHLEQGSITLEDSLAQFEQAIGLLENCQVILKKAEQRIEILSNKGQKSLLVPFVMNEEV